MAHQIENDESIVSQPYHFGRAGKLMKAAKACTVSGAGLAVVAGHTPRLGPVASGTLFAAGSLLTRFGVFDACEPTRKTRSPP
jgi:hypothetical protein